MKHKPFVFEITHFGTNYVIPQRGKAGSIGYDLTVPEDVLVPAHSRIAIPLNIAINLPYGIEAKIEPRSGLSLKGMEGYGTREVPNLLFGIIPFFWRTISGKMYWDCDVLVGKIDPGYTDNIHVILKNNDKEFTIRRGTRIAQMTFYRVISPEFALVGKLSCKSRGGGLGSTGTDQLPYEDISKVIDDIHKRTLNYEGIPVQIPDERNPDRLLKSFQQNK